MSQFNQNQKVLVSKAVTPDATSVANLADGEIAFVSKKGTVLDGTTVLAEDKFYIAQGTATLGNPKYSQAITLKNITKVKGTSGAAATQQVITIADTTATVTTASTTEATTYVAHIVFTHDKEIGSKRQLARAISYVAPKNTSAANVLVGLAAAINANALARQYVVAAVAGDLIITGLAQTYNVIYGYKQVSFEVGIEGFATVTITKTTAPDPGVGTYALLTDLEYFALGNNGITNRTQFPVPTGAWDTQAVSASAPYDIYVIDSFDRHASADVNTTIDSPLQTIVAIPASATANTTAFEGVLSAITDNLGLPEINL